MLYRSASRTALGLSLALGLSSGGAIAGINDLKGTEPGGLPNGGYFSPAESCSNCHKSKGAMDPDYMPIDTWAGTMMGNAVRDPVFFAALAIANQDAQDVGTFCLRCHSPIAFVRGHATPPDGSGFDPDPAQGLIDTQGVGCDTCHRATTIPDVNDPEFPNLYYKANAQLTYTDDIALTKHGPYSDSSSPNHATIQDLSLADSRFCGQCHEVTNPDRMLKDAAGADTTIEFPFDTTYDEWAQSAFADGGATPKSCIDCHMQKKVGEWPVTNLFGSTLRTDPRDHALVGGNHWGIRAVMEANPDRATTFMPAFNLALARTLDSLEAAAAVTVVGAPAEVAAGEPFTVTVRVENLTGHKFPTGYAESRRAWIAVTLVGADGQERALLGGYDGATGEIQADPATHVYRAVHGRWDASAGMGVPDEHLVLHDQILSDTRIPPAGFVPSAITAPTPEIDYSDGNGGYRSDDEATFTLTAPADLSGAMTLSARVYYQSMTREHIDFLRTENTTNTLGDDLEAIYAATEEAPPILVASADSPLQVGGPPGTGGGGMGGSGGAGAGGGGTAGGGEPADDGGCGCRAAGSDAPAGAIAAAIAGLTLAAARRRRRSR
jgi:MYXO-CTERM domain-containing protein